MALCRVYRLAASFLLWSQIVIINGYAMSDMHKHERNAAEYVDSADGTYSAYAQCDQQPEHTIGLKRYDISGSHSALELAIRNHENFKNGKVSVAKRNEGIFGSIGYKGNNEAMDCTKSRKRRKNSNLRISSARDLQRFIPIHETKDSLYVGEMRIGSPPQLIHPIFDTGSTNLWVVGKSCRDSSCIGVSQYDPSRSSTFQLLDNPINIHVKFGTGEIEGYAAVDTVAFGDIKIPNQSLAVVESEESNESEGNIFDKIKFEGIVGLAFPEMSSVPGTPIFDHIALLENLKRKEFAFYLDDKESKIMLGGVDPACYEGRIEYFPVVREHYWEVELDALFLGEEKICCDDGSAYIIFDSGTSLNTIPSAYFGEFISHFKTKECSENFEDYPTITYVINGKKIKIEPHQYMMNYKDTCTPGYMQLDVPSEFGNAFIAGSNAFMKHYVTVFRRGDNTTPSMVGIAKAKHQGFKLRK